MSILIVCDLHVFTSHSLAWRQTGKGTVVFKLFVIQSDGGLHTLLWNLSCIQVTYCLRRLISEQKTTSLAVLLKRGGLLSSSSIMLPTLSIISIGIRHLWEKTQSVPRVSLLLTSYVRRHMSRFLCRPQSFKI